MTWIQKCLSYTACGRKGSVLFGKIFDIDLRDVIQKICVISSLGLMPQLFSRKEKCNEQHFIRLGAGISFMQQQRVADDDNWPQTFFAINRICRSSLQYRLLSEAGPEKRKSFTLFMK